VTKNDDGTSDEKPAHGYDLLNNVSDAPTIYADGCIFVSTIGNAIRLSFVETIVEPANGPMPGLKTRHVANVVMPADGFANMLEYMNKVKQSWEQAPTLAAGSLGGEANGERASD
jgi:hypothetical protein